MSEKNKKKEKSYKERKTDGENYRRYTFRYILSANGTLVYKKTKVI